jgi:hypothetical protein
LPNSYADCCKVNELNERTANHFFRAVKGDWRTYPDFVGHKSRMDASAVTTANKFTPYGQKSIKASDCNSCHLILALGSGEQLKKLNADGYTFFHIDSEFSEFSCTTCHTGGPQLP